MESAHPRVFPVAQTRIDRPALRAFFDHLGVEGTTDAHSEAEELTEVAGKLCYMSFDTSLNQNLTVTGSRKNFDYIQQGLISTKHGSVLEHATISFIFADVSRIFTHELVRHRAGAAYCLAGDAVVWSGGRVNGRFDGVKRSWTMHELYEKTKTPHGRSRLKLMTVRCLDGDQFQPAKIKSVTYSGKKNVYRVELANGRSVRASKDHRFLGEDGWLRVGEMELGKRLACNGVCWSHTAESREKIRASKTGAKNPMWAGDAVGKSGGYIRAQKMYPAVECAKCGSTKRLQRHHVDRDPTNNTPANVEVLCESCHKALHVQPPGVYPSWSEIVSVTEDGYEDTYDLEVDHTAHNFVVNGIVTHNSQTSGRFVRDRILKFFVPSIIEKDARLEAFFYAAVQEQEKVMEEFVEISGINDMTGRESFSLKKKLTSAFRRIIGGGQATNILATYNHRSLRHLIEQRTSRHAEEEIRLVFEVVYNMVKDMFPAIYADAEAEVIDGYLEVKFRHDKV